jgi:Uma2 family endonuclease
MGIPQAKRYTIDDIYALPDGQRAELIDGQIYMMAPPTSVHQILSSRLSRIIGNYIDSKQGACEVISAPFAVFLNEESNTYVEPDISVICDSSKLTPQGCNGSPDWIIEIVSPSSKKMDYGKKLLKYTTAGVREYWIVDPLTARVTVYDIEHTEMYEYTFADTVKVNLYEDFEIDFSGFEEYLV